MSDTTHEAPERIWTCNETNNIWIPIEQDDTTKYVRADVAHTAQLEAQEETRWQMIRAQQAIDETKALRAENLRLKSELHEASETIDAVWFALDDADPDRAADAVQAFFKARAALQQESEP